MDFVSRLIQEGYTEEQIGDILESIYLIEKNGGENFLAEEAEYIVEVRGFIARQLAKLRGLPQTPAIQKQIKRLQRLVKGGKDKVDDVAQKADDAGGAIVKKADDVVDATKPPGFAETRPGSSTYKPSSSKSKPTTKKGDAPTPPVKPTPKPKPKGDLKSKLGKAALLGAGAATYLSLTNDGTKAPKNSDENVAKPDSSPPGSGDPDDQKNKDTSTAAKHGIPKAPFWWSSTKPKSLGYMANPGLASYRNVRRNEAYEIVMDYLLSEGHADTIQEAEYVMNQMEFDHICEIVERYTLNE